MAYASDLADFQDLLRATADDLNLPIWIVEKDYYVTRALRALQENVGDQFLFKGGTSLSVTDHDIYRLHSQIVPRPTPVDD